VKNERDLSKEAFLLLSCIKSCGGRWGLNLPIDVLRGSRVNLYPFCFSFLQWWHTLAACSSFDLCVDNFITGNDHMWRNALLRLLKSWHTVSFWSLHNIFYFRRSKWLNHSDNSQSSWVDGVEERGIRYATCERFLHTWFGVNASGSRVDALDPVLCDYGLNSNFFLEFSLGY
jgi:hypothetical protein